MKEKFLERIHPLGLLLHRFSHALGEPSFSLKEHSFRYSDPDYRHFCLLRGVRTVSALSAVIDLAKLGYPQEIGVLFRTIQECCSDIDAVVSQIHSDGEISGELAEFILDFFQDNERSETKPPRKNLNLSRKYVNSLIAKHLDSKDPSVRNDPSFRSAADRNYKINEVFSNYVHARYPEFMDLFGGIPGRFHFYGMPGTPKDAENEIMVDAIITKASRCLLGMVLALKLQNVIRHDRTLVEWYNRHGD